MLFLLVVDSGNVLCLRKTSTIHILIQSMHINVGVSGAHAVSVILLDAAKRRCRRLLTAFSPMQADRL